MVWVGREAVGDDAAGSACTDDDKIEFTFKPPCHPGFPPNRHHREVRLQAGYRLFPAFSANSDAANPDKGRTIISFVNALSSYWADRGLHVR
jgi:hypothetical protein